MTQLGQFPQNAFPVTLQVFFGHFAFLRSTVAFVAQFVERIIVLQVELCFHSVQKLFQAADERIQCSRNGERGRSQQFAEYHRDERPLTFRQCIQFVRLQIIRDKIVEFFFCLSGCVFLQNGMPLCVSNILRNLFAKRTLAKATQTGAKIAIAEFCIIDRNIHFAERLGIAKYMVIDKANEPIKLHQIVLERSRCE